MAEPQQSEQIPAAVPPPEAPPAEVVVDPALEQARHIEIPDFTSVDAEKPLTEDEVDALISHDPFKDGPPDYSRVPPAQAQPETPPAAPGSVPAAPPTAQPAAPVVAPVAQPLVPAPAPQQDPQMAALMQQNALLQQQIVAMQAALPAQPQGQIPGPQIPGQQPVPQADALPAYSYEMPQQIVQGLFGEDGDMGTRSRALGALVQGLGKTIHQEMRQEVQTRMQSQIPDQVSQQVQTAVSREQERARIFDDFYHTYPQFNQPAYLPIVAQAAQMVQQEIGATTWTPYMREQVAQKTAILLGGQQQQLQQQQIQQPQQFVQPQQQQVPQQFVQQPPVQQVSPQGLPVAPIQYAPAVPPTPGLPVGPPMQFAPGANPLGVTSPEANGGINSPTDIYQVMGI